MYADDHGSSKRMKNDLQKSLFNFNILTHYNQIMPLSKIKVMASSGADHIRTKICIQNSRIEQVSISST